MLPKPWQKTGKARTSEGEHPRATCVTSQTRKGRPRKEKLQSRDVWSKGNSTCAI
jgi:hypothetical protein